ncbi:hypothetical protein [Streptomyces sp. bgisy027]|uniref:hypothetical protein n=1 Tax=Streptomyces sp. bgisy027 TaxID=3413770 RepID=UPI003D74F7D1
MTRWGAGRSWWVPGRRRPPGERAAADAAVVQGPLPDSHAALKAGLTVPLARGRSPIRDFHAWRRAARARAEEPIGAYGHDDAANHG